MPKLTHLCAALALSFGLSAPAKAVVYSVDLAFAGEAFTTGVNGTVSGTFEYFGNGNYGEIDLVVSGTGLTTINGALVDGVYDTVAAFAAPQGFNAVRGSLGPDFSDDPTLTLVFEGPVSEPSPEIAILRLRLDQCSNGIDTASCGTVAATLMLDTFDAPLPTVTAAVPLPPTAPLLLGSLALIALRRARRADA